MLYNTAHMRRWRSGQSHLTVNQAPHGFAGSNPARRTSKNTQILGIFAILAQMKIDERNLLTNTLFLGDRAEVFPKVKEEAEKYFKNIELFEIEKLNISVDDIRRMTSFVNRTSENTKIVMLSSFYWMDEAQNAMLKVLEETPANTFIYLFGLNEKNFLKTILSRVQKVHFKNTNRYLKAAGSVLALDPNERLEDKQVKKILALKTSDVNFDKNTESEKKDREAHILFLQALIDVLLEKGKDLEKNFLEKVLKITTIAEIEGGSPHLFIEWLLLSAPKIVV